MSGAELQSLLAGMATDTPPALTVSGLSLDSRTLKPGDLFLALAGDNAHGLDYLPQAEAADVAAVAFEPVADGDAPETRLPTVAVAGLRFKAGLIADRFYQAPSAELKVVGITGTNGKTTCSYLLAQALNRAGCRAGVIGTLGAGLIGQVEAGERTTPDAVQVHRYLRRMLEQGASAVAMEVSSHALAQGRVQGVRFEVAVFTNLTRDHLDYHSDMAAYGAAKARLFEWPDLVTAVINVDDPFGRGLAQQITASVQCLPYSLDDDAAPIRAAYLELHADGLSFELHTPAGSAPVQSRLLGRFNASNLLAVAACLHVFGWDAVTIAARLRDLAPVPGRMERVPADKHQPLVVIDYAHTPDALEQALQALKPHTQGRLVVVFGAGGDRDAGKRAPMGRVAEALADEVVLTDDNPRGEDAAAIIEQIRAGMQRPQRARVIQPRSEAVAAAIRKADPHDVVLVAGKGVEGYQEMGTQRMAYNDREAAMTVLSGGSHER